MRRPDRKEIAAHLGGTTLLGDLSDVELAELAARTRQVSLKSRQMLYGRLTKPKHVYHVISGRLTISVTGRTGNDLLLSVVEPGEFVGLVGMIDGSARGVDAKAVSPSHLLAIERAAIFQMFHRNAAAAMKLAALFHDLTRRAVRNVETLGLDSARARLWRRLMELARQYGRTDPSSGALEIRHQLSQQRLADSVGLTRVMVNRQLSRWRGLGLIDTGRGFVVIPSPTALEDDVLANLE